MALETTAFESDMTKNTVVEEMSSEQGAEVVGKQKTVDDSEAGYVDLFEKHYKLEDRLVEQTRTQSETGVSHREDRECNLFVWKTSVARDM